MSSLDDLVEIRDVAGGKLEREIAEHNKLMEYTGGKAVKTSDVVSNKVDPIGKKRLEKLIDAGRDVTPVQNS